MDVVEMDAASNRGIDDIRDLRDKVHFSPVEGRMKVYIVDEVHMLTPEAFNALLKTLEEPPIHAVFVLATTEPHKVPATILSRCQRFDFRRPSIREVVGVLTDIAKQEGIEVAEASLTVIARAAGGSFRDAIGILDQLATYAGGSIGLQETLDILGVVQHDLLFEIVDLVHEGDTQGALLFVERLNESGNDYTQFIKDLLSHLRDLYVVKHTDDTPASIAATEEQLERLRSQATRVSTAQTVSFIDLLGEALRSIRQGSDARLELELVLIKLTSLRVMPPAAVSAGGNALMTEASSPVTSAATARPVAAGPQHTITSPSQPVSVSPATVAPTSAGAASAPAAPAMEPTPGRGVRADIDHLRRAWPVLLEAVKKRQPGLAAVLGEGQPDSLDGNELLIKFPAGYGFQANLVAREDNRSIVAEALREVTGKDLRVATKLVNEPAPEAAAKSEDARILSRDELLRVLRQEFDARVVDDGPAR
jgi:DNA polymerase-3 subunit gamma/tau